MKSEKVKKSLTPEQLYKKNQKKSNICKRLAPIFFWVFIGLTILFSILMIENSIGNILEIIGLLDKKAFTGEQLELNYAYLVEKYGEWIVFGENGGLVRIKFIDIKSAMFSGLMITYLVFAIITLALAIIIGKILLPKLSKYFENNNQDMVNIATLQTNAEIVKKNKHKEEDWF